MLARGLPEPKENPAAVYAFRGGSVSFVSASVLAIARRRRSPHRSRSFARCIGRRLSSIGSGARAIAIVSCQFRPGVPCRVRAARLSKRAHPLAREPPHPLLRQSRRISAKRCGPGRKTLLVREPQIHQNLHPVTPFGGKRGRKDCRITLQRRGPLRPAKDKPGLGRSVDPEHFTPALIDEPHDVWRRAARLHHAHGWRPAIPKEKNAASNRIAQFFCISGAMRGVTMAK